MAISRVPTKLNSSTARCLHDASDWCGTRRATNRTIYKPNPPPSPRRCDAQLSIYPSIRVSQEQINAAAAGIQLARTAYLPRIDLLAQGNRATNNLGTAWGSAMGTLVTWEPFDFGLRQSRVAAATAARAQYVANLKRIQFEVIVAAANACVTLAAAQETVRAAQAGVDRAGVLHRVIRGQVNAQLRPEPTHRAHRLSLRLREHS